ncbi:hypothetical protein [Bacillus sp. JCM 19041]|uniref:hypothetical protein n=1 Tax=Bacillus sp. JCM 19041 TaxID=1460637 RepID=UPI000B2DB0A6
MGHLTGFHVALTASRKTDEMQALLHKQGATCEVRSMQGTVATVLIQSLNKSNKG